jgi:hypothetical protein
MLTSNFHITQSEVIWDCRLHYASIYPASANTEAFCANKTAPRHQFQTDHRKIDAEGGTGCPMPPESAALAFTISPAHG